MTEHGLPFGRKEARLDPGMGELLRIRKPLIDEAHNVMARAIYAADPDAYFEIESTHRTEAAPELSTVAGAAVKATIEPVADEQPADSGNLLTEAADMPLPDQILRELGSKSEYDLFG